MSIIAREVEFAQGQPVETYHAVGQRDYIAIVARTPNGGHSDRAPIRPAVEAFTWELPAGLVDRGEELAETARRELLEETGYAARSIVSLGMVALHRAAEQPRPHVFIETGEQVKPFAPEPGVERRPS